MGARILRLVNRMRWTILLVASIAVGCGSSPAPGPSPIPLPPTTQTLPPTPQDCFTVIDPSGRALFLCDQANLTGQDNLRFTVLEDGASFRVEGDARNRGTRCATQITGVTTITLTDGSAPAFDLAWSLPADQRVPPGGTFTYPLGRVTFAALGSGEGTYSTAFRFVSVVC
jgi:hypothetical protein